MFPTRHWRALFGSLNPGASAPVAHGLRDGMNGTMVTPDAMVDLVESTGVWARGSAFVAPYQAWDTTNVYLSNYDPAQVRGYHLLVRSYWSGDDTNQ